MEGECLSHPCYAASLCALVPWDTPHPWAPGRRRRSQPWVSLQEPVLPWCWLNDPLVVMPGSSPRWSAAHVLSLSAHNRTQSQPNPAEPAEIPSALNDMRKSLAGCRLPWSPWNSPLPARAAAKNITLVVSRHRTEQLPALCPNCLSHLVRKGGFQGWFPSAFQGWFLHFERFKTKLPYSPPVRSELWFELCCSDPCLALIFYAQHSHAFLENT